MKLLIISSNAFSNKTNNGKTLESIFNFEKKETFTGVVKDMDKTIAYYLNGTIHREDGPAIQWSYGDKRWCINGKLHREDGPAVEHENGDKAWYLNGKCYGYNDNYTNESWIRFVKLKFLK